MVSQKFTVEVKRPNRRSFDSVWRKRRAKLRFVLSGGSYLSTNDSRPHFGLGQATSVDAIEVHWPSGKVEKFTVPGVDRIVTITEGTGK